MIIEFKKMKLDDFWETVFIEGEVVSSTNYVNEVKTFKYAKLIYNYA